MSLIAMPARTWTGALRRPLGTLAVLVALLAIFTAANPDAFTRWTTYNSVLIAVPVVIMLVVPLTFVVVSGEIDLSFPSIMGIAGWAFALACQAGWSPFLALVAALVAGVASGWLVGLLVVGFGLSSLVATLGMNFMLRGVINLGSEGHAIAIPALRQSALYELLAGKALGIPMQMIWAILFVVFATLLFHFHRFGVRTQCVGDNPESAAQMGIPVDRVRVQVFVFMGFGAALAGVFSVLINFVWWPTSGEGYLLPVVAAVFVGGTPTWGGVGTIVGGALGALIVSFIETGVLAAGLAGFYTQFFNGLIIVLALIGHRLHGKRVR
jgi:simple sugar transport system permease protein